MRSFTSVALLAAAAAGTVRADNIECADGLYMLIARGTGEDPGPGETGKVANRIKDQIENSTVKGLDYPASFNGEVGDNNYFESVEKGYEAMKVAIQQYYDACPDHKMAIFGYSQGAQISSDALCGGSGGWFNDDRPPVDIDIIEKSSKSMERRSVPVPDQTLIIHLGRSRLYRPVRRPILCQGCSLLSRYRRGRWCKS
jgi:acetylxylan esterase